MIRLEQVTIKTNREMSQYEDVAPAACRNIKKIAAHMQKRLVIHINATPIGGGVAELLQTQTQLENSVGLDSRWLTLEAPSEFYDVTKKIHNLLQGKGGMLSEEEEKLFLHVNKELGKSLQDYLSQYESGTIVVHDPQPAPMISAIPSKFSTILRIHIDLTAPNPHTLEFLRPYAMKYQSVVVSNASYRPVLPWLPPSRISVIHPAIDPLNEKNKDLKKDVAQNILNEFGISTTRPIVTQVSRFDPWKDPLGAIRAFYIAKNRIEDLQLILAGFWFAQDDPEAKEMFDKVEKYAKGDHSVHLFSDPSKLREVSNDTFINALYTASTVILQKSLREGFGLTITEAMWKRKPVVAGRASGPMLQIANGKNGLLVNSPEEAAEAIVRLVSNKKLREKIGKAAHASVKRQFLMPRYIMEHMRLYGRFAVRL